MAANEILPLSLAENMRAYKDKKIAFQLGSRNEGAWLQTEFCR
jgi:hypothetical protein